MNTFLLILNIIMNIFIIINIIDIKKRMYSEKPKRLIDTLNEDDEIDDDFDYDDEELDEQLLDEDISDGYEKEESYYNANILEEVICDTYNEENKYLKGINLYKYYGTFKDTNDFINYVSMRNLKIIDVINREIKTIKYLDSRVYNNREQLIIIFDDNTEAAFKPYLFTKYTDVYNNAA